MNNRRQCRTTMCFIDETGKELSLTNNHIGIGHEIDVCCIGLRWPRLNQFGVFCFVLKKENRIYFHRKFRFTIEIQWRIFSWLNVKKNC